MDRIARGFDAIYRFLASLKLAVISISTLAATLAYATVFESSMAEVRLRNGFIAAPDSRSCWRFSG